MNVDPDPVDRSVFRGVAYGCGIEAGVALVVILGGYALLRWVGAL